MTLDYVRAACQKINLSTETFGGNLWIYGENGLLRSFNIAHLGQSEPVAMINARDFANWWRFMGYDNAIHG